MKGGDASDEEPEELFPDTGKAAPTTNRESKKEREERLKKMMEDDDEDDDNEKAIDANGDGVSHSTETFSLNILIRPVTDQEMPDAEEPEEEPEEPVTIEQPLPKKQELKEEVTVQGGRRRGKRQVMKKKTVKDDEGYLGKISLSLSTPLILIPVR